MQYIGRMGTKCCYVKCCLVKIAEKFREYLIFQMNFVLSFPRYMTQHVHQVGQLFGTYLGNIIKIVIARSRKELVSIPSHLAGSAGSLASLKAAPAIWVEGSVEI